MSMIKVERQKIKNNNFYVTDYMYEGDNIGINLSTLNNTKTTKLLKIPCLPISYTATSFSNTSSEISVTANLVANDSNDITIVFDIKYPDKTITETVKLDDVEFATDMINTCILDKKDIKEIACYKNAFNNMIEEIKNKALEENILIKTPELKMKSYLYTEDLSLLGVSNRLMLISQRNEGRYVLGEYCGKKLTEFTEDSYGERSKFVIDICVNDDIMIQLTNVELTSSTDSTLGYAIIDASSARLVRIPNYNKTPFKTFDGLQLPEYKQGWDDKNYFEKFFIGNAPSDIEKLYKLNKVSTNPTIDINKYLIW